jgi:hypothetical protein
MASGRCAGVLKLLSGIVRMDAEPKLEDLGSSFPVIGFVQSLGALSLLDH